MCPTKSSRSEQIVAALAILEHGPRSAESAVAANVDELRPPQAMVDSARRAFAELGFRVANTVGNSFSIEAPIARFHDVFKVDLRVGRDGVVTVRKGKSGRSLELPVDALPKDVRGLVRTVTFSEPPAFGPSGSGP